MTAIKALEKLREISHHDDNKWTLASGEVVFTFNKKPEDPQAVNWGEEWRKLADAIEAEVAEKFMEPPQEWTCEQAANVLAYWPKWDDGSPCMFGDEFTCYPKYCGEKEYETLDRLSIFGPNHVWNRGHEDERPHDGGYYEWNYMRPGGDGCEEYRPTKRKPRMLEDVLRDVWKEALDYAKSDMWRSPDEVLSERADEIREIFGVDE